VPGSVGCAVGDANALPRFRSPAASKHARELQVNRAEKHTVLYT
jgi:hypothetical protein